MGLLYVYVTDPVASKLGPGRIIKRLLDTINRLIRRRNTMTTSGILGNGIHTAGTRERLLEAWRRAT
jgi:hypothetical protein